MEAGVALQAELPPFTPHQQHAIGAAVGIVADHASFHPHRRVFIKIRSALFHVALDAGLPPRVIQTSAIDAAVWIVTVRTLYQLFRYAVMHGQGKQRLDVAMTFKA
jgi:hypothetical protein